MSNEITTTEMANNLKEYWQYTHLPVNCENCQHRLEHDWQSFCGLPTKLDLPIFQIDVKGRCDKFERK